MKYYTKLTDDEIKIVCYAYPYRELINGFKKCSKDFSSLMPGHRQQRVSEEVGRKLIADNSNSNLTAKMVEALLSTWVSKVKESVEKQIKDGKSKDLAYIFAFSEFNLPGCIQIFFRFSNEDFTEDHISAICAGVEALLSEREKALGKTESAVALDQVQEEQKRCAKELKEKSLELRHKIEENKDLLNELADKNTQIQCLLAENQKIADFQQSLSVEKEKVDTLTDENELLTRQVSKLQEMCAEHDRQTQKLVSEKSTIQAQLERYYSQIEELETAKRDLLDRIYMDTIEELRPVDMDEFIEYLSYNLKSIGLSDTQEYFSVFLDFLSHVLFRNKPIICNQAVGHALARCVSNTLCGNPNPMVITYNGTITNGEIRTLLETEERVVILDGFIGIYDEMELLPLLNSIKRKIIFVTTMYEQTMAYLLPEEVLCYCTYINANRLPELFLMNHSDEDPSTIHEDLMEPAFEAANSYAQRLCKEIMCQLGFSAMVADIFSAQMTSEAKLVEYLVFSIVPYSIEVFGESPYGVSERLQKYAGPNGKCSKKNLLLEWFGDE